MFEVTRDRLASHPREGAVLKAASCHLKMESSGGLGSSDPWNRLYVLNFLFFFQKSSGNLNEPPDDRTLIGFAQLTINS